MNRPANLAELQASGWKSKTVKQEIRDNFIKLLASDQPMYPGIVGYEHTVIPEINIALLAGHDMLFLGEKGQAKSRLMRSLVRFWTMPSHIWIYQVSRFTKILFSRSHPRRRNS